MSTPVAAPHQEPRPWTRSDIASAFTTFVILYALSPPWVVAFMRATHAPEWVLNIAAFCYHPVTLARQNISGIDFFYNAYRLLLQPWLSGIPGT